MILSMDTSTSAGCLALLDPNGAVRGEIVLDTRVRHSAALVSTVLRLLSDAGVVPRDLTGVVVGLGPGSFTGIRIGVSAALGFRAGTGCELRAVSSYDAVALHFLRGTETASGIRRIAVAGYARPGVLYRRSYGVDPAGGVRPLEPCRVGSAEELADLDPDRIVSSDPARIFERFGGDLPLRDRWHAEAVLPDAACLAEAARGTDPLPPGIAPEPIYLHPPVRTPPR